MSWQIKYKCMRVLEAVCLSCSRVRKHLRKCWYTRKRSSSLCSWMCVPSSVIERWRSRERKITKERGKERKLSVSRSRTRIFRMSITESKFFFCIKSASFVELDESLKILEIYSIRNFGFVLILQMSSVLKKKSIKKISRYA